MTTDADSAKRGLHDQQAPPQSASSGIDCDEGCITCELNHGDIADLQGRKRSTKTKENAGTIKDCGPPYHPYTPTLASDEDTQPQPGKARMNYTRREDQVSLLTKMDT